MISMIRWQFDEEDARIIFLIKTMKRKYVEDTLKEGTFCFNLPDAFHSATNLHAAQFDDKDSYATMKALDVTHWPIISENEDGITYGEPKVFAKHAIAHEISTVSQHTPLCCFRKVLEEDFAACEGGSVFKLGKLVDRIKTEFGHDSYILILRPGEMLKRMGKVSSYFAKSIHYGYKDWKYQDFLDKYEFEQTEMFQKRMDYAWQKEFRIILPADQSANRRILHIGSIEDIAIAGDIEELREGLLIADAASPITSAVTKIKSNIG